MYQAIHVPVDNSDHSAAAVELGARLGKALGASMTCSHVYAAKLHDVRFKQMEFTLPDEYKEEEELEKQRKIHDALIARGLHLISDSYLDQAEDRCRRDGVPFERKHFDGRNFEAIAKDVRESGYDLVIMGALGMGAVKGSQVGSVCERVLRRTATDTIVVRDVAMAASSGQEPVVACLDGSAWSWGAVRSALALGRALARPVRVVAVVAATGGDATEDDLLVRHLQVASDVASKVGVPATTSCIAGGLTELALWLGEARPFMVAVGRAGLDAPEAQAAGIRLGATTDHLLRAGSWNLLIAARGVEPSRLLEAGLLATSAA